MKAYRYYLTQRPPMPGSFPQKGVIMVGEYADRTMIDKIGRKAWGYVDYEMELSTKDAASYELVYGGSLER